MAARWLDETEQHEERRSRYSKQNTRNPFLPVVYGLLAAALAFGWQTLTVRYNWGGEWSGLFHTGSSSRLPPDLGFERTRRVPQSPGFDGQFYHVIAHDPWMTRQFSTSVDKPRLRWRRILLPALAWILAVGQDGRVDAGFIAANLLFVALGAFWLSQFAVRCGLHEAWGLLFPLVPATLVSLDRMTVDVALSALCAGFAVHSTASPRWAVLAPILALAPLASEAGVCLALAFSLVSLRRKAWVNVGASMAMLLPSLLWTVYVHTRTFPNLAPRAGFPLSGLIARTVHPFPNGTATTLLKQAAVLDLVGILGIWLALALVLQLFLLRRTGPLETAAALFGAGAVFLGKADIWAEAYGFARILSPLLVCLLLAGMSSRFWLAGAPLMLCIPPVVFQFGPQFYGILHAWMGRK